MKFVTDGGLEICADTKRKAAMLLRNSRIELEPLLEEVELTCIDPTNEG